jgi:hypothetical protein
MRQRKFTFLLIGAVIAAGLFFSGGEALAAFSYQLQYVSSSNAANSATYKYSLNKLDAASSPVSYVNFAIPVGICIKEGQFTGGSIPFGNCVIPAGMGGFSNQGSASVTAISATITGLEVFPPGVGDYGSKYGYGDTSVRVLKVSFGTVPSGITPFTLTLTLSGQSFTPDPSTLQPYVFGPDSMGSVLLKPSQGTNTLSFVTNTPDVVLQPVAATSAVSNLAVTPNPIVPPTTFATVTWTGPSAVTITGTPDGGGSIAISGNSATITPPANNTTGAITYYYTITAAGCSNCAPETFTITVNPPPPPTISVYSISPNPVHLVVSGGSPVPVCTTITYNATYTNQPVTISGITVGAGDSGANFFKACFTAPGTYPFMLTATGQGGTATADGSVTVQPAWQVGTLEFYVNGAQSAQILPTQCDPDAVALNPALAPKLTCKVGWTDGSPGAAYAFISNIGTWGGVVPYDNVNQGELRLTGRDCPLENVTYTFTAIGWSGTVDTKTVSVEVLPDPTVATAYGRTPIFIEETMLMVSRNKYGDVLGVEVCNDPDFYKANPRCGEYPANPPPTVENPACCAVEKSPNPAQKYCQSLEGGKKECIIAKPSGTPHHYDVTTPTSTYTVYSCLSTETRKQTTVSPYYDCCTTCSGPITVISGKNYCSSGCTTHPQSHY